MLGYDRRMKTPSFAANLITRAFTSLAAIAAVSVIIGAKALEHERIAEGAAPRVALAPADAKPLTHH